MYNIRLQERMASFCFFMILVLLVPSTGCKGGGGEKEGLAHLARADVAALQGDSAGAVSGYSRALENLGEALTRVRTKSGKPDPAGVEHLSRETELAHQKLTQARRLLEEDQARQRSRSAREAEANLEAAARAACEEQRSLGLAHHAYLKASGALFWATHESEKPGPQNGYREYRGVTEREKQSRALLERRLHSFEETQTMRVVRTAGAYVRYLEVLRLRSFSVRLVKSRGASRVVFARSAWPATTDPRMSWWWTRSPDQASSDLLALVASTGDRALMERARSLDEHVRSMERLDVEFVDTFFDLRRVPVGDRIAIAVPAYLRTRDMFETRLEELLAKAECPGVAMETELTTPRGQGSTDGETVAAVTVPAVPSPVLEPRAGMGSLSSWTAPAALPTGEDPFENLNHAER